GEVLRGVLLLLGEPGDDRLLRALGYQLARGQAIAVDRAVRGVVEPAVAYGDAAAAAGAEGLLGLRAAVAVRVTERYDPAVADLDVDVAARADRDEAEL